MEKLLNVIKKMTKDDSAYYVEDEKYKIIYVKFKDNINNLRLQGHVYLIEDRLCTISGPVNPALMSTILNESTLEEIYDIYTGKEFLEKWKDYDTVYSCIYEKNTSNEYQIKISHKNSESIDSVSILNSDGLVFVYKSTKDIYTSWVKIIL